jgi:hypothetical protein
MQAPRGLYAQNMLRITTMLPAILGDGLDPKAIACYGLALHWYEHNQLKHGEVWLRFVEGNPCSDLTIQYLEWLLEKTRLAGKKCWS